MQISRIDHVHVYVKDIGLAEQWYKEVLGFTRDETLFFWFEQGGPLVIKNNDVSLSLFVRKEQDSGHTIAFRVNALELVDLVPVLSERQIAFSVCDHDVSMSVYFTDPSGNKIEITSYEYKQAKENLRFD